MTLAGTQATPSPSRHSLFDGLQGLATGALYVAIGLMLFRQAGLMTGATAGIALLLHCASG